MPRRGREGGFGKCCVRVCILCVLGAGWKGWCTPPGEGRLGSGAPLPHFKKTRLEMCIGLYAER